MRRLLKYALLSPTVRGLCDRVGPAYWRLPRELRRRLVRESGLPKLAGAKCYPYGEAEFVRPTPPLFPAKPPTFGHRLSARPYRLRQPFMVELPGAWLVGKHATPVTPRGEVLMTSFRNQPRIMGLEPQEDVAEWVRSKRWREAPGDPVQTFVMPMVNRLDPNYFHRLTEYCGWIEALDQGLAAKPGILIRASGPSFLRESLALLGHGDRLIEWDDRASQPAVFVERLCVGSLPSTWSACSPGRLRWLRERFRASCGAAVQPSAERLYIPRAKGGWRHVVNDDPVSAVLARHGFRTVYPHELTLAEQVRLFARADIVVGMHGAGLTNLMFSNDAALIELTGSYGGGDYHSLCSALGLAYGAVVGDPRGDDIHINPDELSRAIDRMDRRPRPALQQAA